MVTFQDKSRGYFSFKIKAGRCTIFPKVRLSFKTRAMSLNIRIYMYIIPITSLNLFMKGCSVIGDVVLKKSYSDLYFQKLVVSLRSEDISSNLCPHIKGLNYSQNR